MNKTSYTENLNRCGSFTALKDELNLEMGKILGR